ncbi:mechanosensitive ion channel domain-containing protein [Cylindrospermum stagnale]|uniref:mechanosensitive ion channel domain-containing protein n=1 Tax=Cylindrospermum stagnale TaxID=142864 RepID=UPI00030F2AE6|nr:mechanosensitive ion channel domain-containing protein [Cylindrospermum stagnale]
MICGFFILFENYYLLGDYIEAGTREDMVVVGIVEVIEFRTNMNKKIPDFLKKSGI